MKRLVMLAVIAAAVGSILGLAPSANAILGTTKSVQNPTTNLSYDFNSRLDAIDTAIVYFGTSIKRAGTHSIDRMSGQARGNSLGDSAIHICGPFHRDQHGSPS
jgi:hypothetical protein